MTNSYLKIGSILLRTRRSFSSTVGDEIHRIVSETRTQWRTNYGTSVRKSDLLVIGAGKWEPRYMKIPTEDSLNGAILMKKRNKIKDAILSSYKDLSDEQCQKIYKIVRGKEMII